MQKVLFTLTLLFFTVNFGFAQSYDYVHLTINDGLSSSEVYQVFQDSKGFIWFATDNGVNRYNGYEMQRFTVNEGLSDNTILEIFEDYKNRIWFYSNETKLSFFLEDTIVQFKHNDRISKTLTGSSIFVKQSLYVDTCNTVYFSFWTNNRGTIRITDDGEVHMYDPKYNILINNNHSFINRMNTINDTLLIHFEDEDWSVKMHVDLPYNYRFAYYSDSVLFLSSSNTLYKIKNGICVEERYFEKEVIWISYEYGELWVGTYKGVYCFNEGNISSKPSRFLLKDYSVSSVLIDKEKGYWFSTLEDGVYYLPNINIESLNINNSALTYPKVSCVYSDSMQILFGCSNGNFGYIKDRELHIIPTKKDSRFTVNEIIHNNTNGVLLLSFNEIYKVLSDVNNDNFVLEKLCNKGGRKIIAGSDSLLWVFQRNGIVKVDTIGNFTLTPLNIDFNLKSFDGEPINDNELLLGTNKGLWRYNHTLNTFNEEILIKEQLGRVTCIQAGLNGNLWIGTKEKGIIVWNKDKDKVTRISCQDGLDCNYITCFFKQGNSMWVGTKESGIYRIDSSSSGIKPFSIQSWAYKHGLLSNEINDIIVNDSSAIIASNYGISILNYKKDIPNITPPPIFIEKIKVNNIEQDVTTSFKVDYKHNSIDIQLVGLSYKQFGVLKYKYRLLNSSANKDWTSSQSRNINLPYLPPGNYAFEAKAVNENSIESKESAVLKFIITPPFWKVWWFIIIIMLTIILAIYVIYMVRIKVIYKRNQVEKEFLVHKNKLVLEIEKHKQQALSQQMNPHFIFNSLNSIQLFIYQNNKELSSKYLSRFSKLIRIILENSQHQTISLDMEFDALKLYLELEEMRLQGKMEFEIAIDKEINADFYRVPPLIFQPIVENAIWHGIVHLKGNGKVKINLKEQENCILCVIEDNGIGREKSKQIKKKKERSYKSMGTKITKKRLELLNSRYDGKMNIVYHDLYNGPTPSGTRVEITIAKITKY